MSGKHISNLLLLQEKHKYDPTFTIKVKETISHGLLVCEEHS